MKPGWTTLIAGLNLLIWGVALVFLINAASNQAFFPAAWPALFFFVWDPRLYRGSVKVPRRSYALFAVGAVLSLGYFLFGVQGVWYTYALFAAEIALVAALGFIFAWRWKGEPSFRTNLFLHWNLFAWLAWFAFPLLGRMVWT